MGVEVRDDVRGGHLDEPVGREARLPVRVLARRRHVALAVVDGVELGVRLGVLLRRDDTPEVVMKRDPAVKAVPPAPRLHRLAAKPAELPAEEGRLAADGAARDGERLPPRHVVAVLTRHEPADADDTLQELAHAELGAPRRGADDDDAAVRGVDEEAVAVEARELVGQRLGGGRRADVDLLGQPDRLGAFGIEHRQVGARRLLDVPPQQVGRGGALRIGIGRHDNHRTRLAGLDEDDVAIRTGAEGQDERTC